MKRLLYTLLGFVLYLALVIAVAFLLHLTGQKFVLFIMLLALLGALACAVILWYLKKIAPPGEGDAGTGDTGNLDALLRDADAKLKQANRGAKSLAALPLLYVIGDENSAKTQTILQSGLDPELLSGQVYRDQAVVPTAAANVWLTGTAAIVEAGGALLRQPALWQRLVKLTAPGKLGTALSKSALQPTRAVILCVSIERILAPSTSEQIRALAQTMNERLRQVSQTLGISLPVYVLFTKLDTVPAFADYAANLTQAEVATPIGSLLARLDTGAGLYAEQAATQIGARFDEVAYLLSEFRLELLGRGGEAPVLARSYEFPRDLRKLRAGIVDLLVEVGRPSQIGVNPFLRGFFFSGMRAHIVEDVLSVGAAQQTAASLPDAGATRVFSFTSAQQPAAPAPVRRASTKKIAQWAFLPYLFSHLVLNDKTALESSRASTKVSGVKRVLIACLCAIFALYLILLTVSFFHNRDLEGRAANATRPVPMTSGKEAVASVADLQTLDQLRLLLVELDGYHRDGAPLSYRWGLYHGEQVRAAACRAYGTRFNRLLLAQTQGNIISKLSALPVKAAPTDEYQASYKPLKAWLITTSNPEKSSDFLPPVLEQEWLAGRPIPPETQQLAQNQFDYYSVALASTDPAQPHSCLASLNGGKPDATLVANTRAFLNSFQGIDHVYLSMKAAADRRFPAIEFKKLYPNSVRIVTAPTIIDGAFSKDGFTFMQNAIAHPDQYLSGEEWVTGPSTSTIDRGTLNAQLSTRYQNDFLTAWRTYLKTAHVLAFGTLEDAATRLHELDGPASPLLQILGVASKNTAVNFPAYSQPFQAPQSVVPPAGPAVNPGYTEKLAAIEQAIHQMLSTPATANDPSGVNAAVTPADAAVSALRGGFQPPDPAGIADAATERLLREPIHAAGDLAIKAPAAGAKKAGEDFCAATKGVLGKFPFNPDSKEDASPEEAAAFFGPAGPIAKFTTEQAKLIAFNGTLYTAVTPDTVNPALLNFLNATHAVATTLFAGGSTQPALSFTLAQEKSPDLQPATVEIDGATFSNIGVPNRIAWQYHPQGTVKLSGSGQTKNNFGPWSIFHFAYAARHPIASRLEYVFQNNGITEKSPTGADIIYRFDIEDNGARLLNPAFMKSQVRCVSTVAK